MKRLIYILLCATIGLLPAHANIIFEKFANEKNVTYINVSKSLLSMMDGQLELDALDLESVIDELDRIQILTCEENKSLIPQIRKECDIFKKAPYEVLMKVNDSGEAVIIYILPQSEGKIKELVMSVDDNGNEFVLIQLSGNISIDKLQNLTKNM